MQRGARAGRCCRRLLARSPPAAVRRAPPDSPYVWLVPRSNTSSATTQRSMLHHAPSPPPVQLYAALTSSDASSDVPEEPERAQPKIRRRNYNCGKCDYNTQNPRAYLIHSRDVHFEKIKIYECQHCIYASKFNLKLLRHMKIIHGINIDTRMESDTYQKRDDLEKMEDMFEEVEDCDDDEGLQMQVDDYSMPMNVDVDIDVKDKEKEKYSCTKCNYVTHIRSRYTKHVKYHSMPMVKCTICEFRTPYKWNLDRHMKNHGGNGKFHCSICNFTADIKQSATVHVMNHHSSGGGQGGGSRRRNRVGGSDAALADDLIEAEDASSDSPAADNIMQFVEKEMVNSDSNDDGASLDMKQAKLSPTQESRSSIDDEKLNKQNRKPPRPIPQLIPLNASTPNQNKAPSGEPPIKRFKESSNDSIDSNKKVEHFPDNPPAGHHNNLSRKKNNSFFDKLKERLLTESGEEGSLVCKSCGFESKCLSEHSVHEKNCAVLANKSATNTSHPNLGSTRCQHCRHRCKSSADLVNHLKTCQMKSETGTPENVSIGEQDDVELKTDNKQSEPHPMENVVFVWNNFNTEANKFDTPLGININDDSTLPDYNVSFDTELVDDNESMNLSPSQAIGKKVFKCPHCQFWASTASRFHVHIVGHLNKKPFECSLCKYKSNWRWDITKHIKLKSARDPFHNEAKVLMTDETGRRNYTKYTRFLAIPVVNDTGRTEFRYIDQNASMDESIDVDESYNEAGDGFNLSSAALPLNLRTYGGQKNEFQQNSDIKKPKKTIWKCKKCNYKDSSKEDLLEHVREHSKAEFNDTKPKKLENMADPADLAYRCGHCNQLSNWKHVIQRHCRLKHDGIIKVITTVRPKPEDGLNANEIQGDTCNKCPFKSEDRKQLLAHVQQHQPSAQSIFKCYFCYFFVKNEEELSQHLLLHGINDPEEYIARAKGCKSPLPPEHLHPGTTINKRHKCTECPYETNSKSQYMYHEQFHRLPAESPYRCPECNYSVSKRHLLHQHLRVHGYVPKKGEFDDIDIALNDSIYCKEINLEEIPFVWVSAKDEFHKMYKCRYCSYVNSQECNISSHEKIHFTQYDGSDVTVYKCLECKFACKSAGTLAQHSKSHGEIYGRIYCPVELDIPDEEQIAKIRKVIEMEPPKHTNDEGSDGQTEVKILYFCQKCPARFFAISELRPHDKFHEATFQHQCTHCKFSTSQESLLLEHSEVHTDEYNTKSKMLKFSHNSHISHQPPVLKAEQSPENSETQWVVSAPSSNFVTDKKVYDTKHLCKECPATFFKLAALKSHMALHGGDGEYKCKKCNYAVTNCLNLAKHEILHENENKGQSCEPDDDIDYKNIPLSGTDLFQRKTEAQKKVSSDKLVKPNDHFPPVLQADPQFGYLMHGNPDFIYPTYMKNGRQREKRYKCHKCPSAFEKREQYKIHLSLHGSKQRYKCELCDYSVKYYANYVQHMRKHQMNDEALAERNKSNNDTLSAENQLNMQESTSDSIKLAIKTMPKGVPKTDFQLFSISDQQTLKLLQRRRSLAKHANENNNSDTSPAKDRKTNVCVLCPYTNTRLDALTKHYKRHDHDAASAGSHKCPYCDFVVFQSHFLREHLKTHFVYQKQLTPECYVANQDVSFVISEEDDGEPTELRLEPQNIEPIKDDKIYVKIQTGEIVVE